VLLPHGASFATAAALVSARVADAALLAAIDSISARVAFAARVAASVTVALATTHAARAIAIESTSMRRRLGRPGRLSACGL